MATANLDPISAARKARSDMLRAGLSSPDPDMRYRAREIMFADGLNDLGRALVKQATSNAKDYEKIVREGEAW